MTEKVVPPDPGRLSPGWGRRPRSDRGTSGRPRTWTVRVCRVVGRAATGVHWMWDRVRTPCPINPAPGRDGG
ncbi:hypothetical protein GCM10007147_27850 [Nocardiopsis kunsanensis]|uniref:Uncharacterized protein n=1 Tax=Nocardiopsis kunsanensis TaxID=141693 RepID=A0A919CJE4_9ACTN|nr:hypothetical protein GCM10007147_27850 [Nocardiopsis kunsanensis]